MLPIPTDKTMTKNKAAAECPLGKMINNTGNYEAAMLDE